MHGATIKKVLIISQYGHFLYLTPQPPMGHGLHIHEVSRSHSTTHHNRQYSSARVFSSSQISLPDNTQHSQQTDIHASWWDSNPQSQQASGRRPTPQTARPLGLAQYGHTTEDFQRHMLNIFKPRILLFQGKKDFAP